MNVFQYIFVHIMPLIHPIPHHHSQMENKSCIDTFVERNEETSTADTSVVLDTSGNLNKNTRVYHVNMSNILYIYVHTFVHSNFHFYIFSFFLMPFIL
jgi:hypothetical protein